MLYATLQSKIQSCSSKYTYFISAILHSTYILYCSLNIISLNPSRTLADPLFLPPQKIPRSAQGLWLFELTNQGLYICSSILHAQLAIFVTCDFDPVRSTVTCFLQVLSNCKYLDKQKEMMLMSNNHQLLSVLYTL